MKNSLLLISLLLFCSCVQFKKQSMTFNHDIEKNELRIFQIYEGLHGEGEKLTEAEIGQLESVLDSERTFFFTNWFFEINKKSLVKDLTDMEAKMKNKNGFSSQELKLMSDVIVLLKHIKNHLSIKNGQFFLNDKNELCAYQEITLKKVSQFIQSCNNAISSGILEEGFDDDLEPKSKELILNAIKQNHQWLRIKGNVITCVIPLAHADYKKAIKSYLADVKDGELGKMARVILGHDLQFYFANGFVNIVIGVEKKKAIELAITVLEETNNSLYQYIKKKHKVYTKIKIDEKRNKFLHSK